MMVMGQLKYIQQEGHAKANEHTRLNHLRKCYKLRSICRPRSISF
jgi:hypothetical protein